MLRVFFFAAAAAAAFATAASAQTIVINPNKSGPMLPPSATESVRISLGVTMFVPTPNDDGAQALKAQEDGRKLVYEAAARECDVLRDTVAKTCTLESININVQHVPANQTYNANKVDGYTINSNIYFRIAPK